MADQYIHGIHDPGGESLHGDRPGWTFITEEVGLNTQAQGRDYREISKLGIRVIVRLNYSHGGGGTIPLPHEYQAFAASCASFVATSQGVWGWVIGNEPNHEGERKDGVVNKPQDYARCFIMCRDHIKAVKPQAMVGPAAMAPFHANPTDWLDYCRIVYREIALKGGCDFLTVHAYTRSMNPLEIASAEKMGPPLSDQFKGFRTFEDVLLKAVPLILTKLPVIITEFDVYGPWLNQNTGVMQAAYNYVNWWNNLPGTQKIIGLICFRWLGPPEVDNFNDWEIRNKPALHIDFRAAVAQGFKVPILTGEQAKPIEPPKPPTKEPDPVPPSMLKRELTPRFLQRIQGEIDFSSPSPGQTYYALIKADYLPPPEGARTFGPDHHILVEVLDENGKRAMGEKVTFIAGDKATTKPVDKQGGPYGVDYDMYDAGYGYSVYVGNMSLLSDFVQKMGMGTIEEPLVRHHTTYYLVFQRKLAMASQPTDPTPPTKPSPETQVPILAHPVADPAKRILTQGFGARPEVYSQYKIDGVPLNGHEGADFGTGIGAQIVAVDGGRVAEVADQGDIGYGKYVKLIHTWGETVYAHLSEQLVKVGDIIARGQVIGLSGWSGNVEPKGPAGAHLHFGLRTNPYNRRDGWGGYRNPLPFLQNSGGGPIPVPVPPSTQPDKAQIVKLIKEAAQEFKVDQWLLLSLIHAESSLNPLSENKATGAKGLGNIMPNTWLDASKATGATNIFDARDNARATAYYLDWCIDQMEGKERQGLWAYILGPTGAKEAMAQNAIPLDVQHYASKIIHGKEVIQWSRL